MGEKMKKATKESLIARAQAKKANEIKAKIAELDKKHERDLRRCIPRALRPTAAEAREEKKLVYRKEEIEKRRKEGGYENKN